MFEALGETGSAESHRKSSRDTVMRLAASLDTYEASRRTFLTSPAVARVLDPDAEPGAQSRRSLNLAAKLPTIA